MYTRRFVAGQCTAVQYAMDLSRSAGHGGDHTSTSWVSHILTLSVGLFV